MELNYTPTTWVNHIVTTPNTFQKTNQGEYILLAPKPGMVVQQGTPINVKNMNRMESAIQYIYDNINQLKGDTRTQDQNIMDLKFEIEAIKGANLSSVNKNLFFERFKTLDNVVLIDGNYDSVNHIITN